MDNSKLRTTDDVPVGITHKGICILLTPGTCTHTRKMRTLDGCRRIVKNHPDVTHEFLMIELAGLI